MSDKDKSDKSNILEFKSPKKGKGQTKRGSMVDDCIYRILAAAEEAEKIIYDDLTGDTTTLDRATHPEVQMFYGVMTALMWDRFYCYNALDLERRMGKHLYLGKEGHQNYIEAMLSSFLDKWRQTIVNHFGSDVLSSLAKRVKDGKNERQEHTIPKQTWPEFHDLDLNVTTKISVGKETHIDLMKKRFKEETDNDG